MLVNKLLLNEILYVNHILTHLTVSKRTPEARFDFCDSEIVCYS